MKAKVRDSVSYLQNTILKLILVHFSGVWLCLFFIAISGNIASPALTGTKSKKERADRLLLRRPHSLDKRNDHHDIICTKLSQTLSKQY